MNTSETPDRKVKFQRPTRRGLTASIVGGAVGAAVVGMLTLNAMNTAAIADRGIPVILVEDTHADSIQPIIDQPTVIRDIVLSTSDESSDGSGQLSMLNYIVTQHPHDPLAYHTRGVFFAEHGSYDKALADYGEAIQLNPQFAEAYLNRGHVYMLIGDPGMALTNYNQAIAMNPEMIEAYHYRGNVLYRLGQYTQSIADYSEAIRRVPTADTYLMRGDAYGALGQNAAAIQDYNESIHSEKFGSLADYNQGTHYFWAAEYQKAVAYYDDAILLLPDYAPAYNGRAYSHFEQGHLDQALADIAVAIELQPGDPNYYDSRCEFYLRSGEWELGLSDCETAEAMGWTFSPYMQELISEARVSLEYFQEPYYYWGGCGNDH